MAPTSPLSRRQRTGVLLICSMSLLIVGLDVTAVNVALPAISRDLEADLAWLQWSVSAYTVTMASLLLFSGALADRIGRRRTLTIGLSVFVVASVLCSLAPTIELLVGARVLQGIGASMLNPVAMSIITNTFTDPAERAQAVGIWGAAFGVSMGLGPLIGGALVSTAGWEWIFLINVPLGLAAIVLLRRYVPESRAPKPRAADPLGQLLITLLLASLTFAVIEGPSAGWSSPLILGAFAAAVVALPVLVVHTHRSDEPVVDPRFFRSVPFSSSIGLAVLTFASFGGFLFLSTLYLQDVRGLSPVRAGLTLVPLALMTAFISPLSGRMVARGGPRRPLLIAGAAFTVASVMLVGLSADTSIAWLLAAFVLFGIGLGFVNAPITNAAVSGMPVAQAGVAAGIATTSRLVGLAMGVAVFGAIVASVAPTATGAPDPGNHAAWWTLAALGALIAVLATLATGERARRSADRVAAELGPREAAV